ncbi:ATPase [Desulfonema ishimotonii]|uniref:ATPase n=1 Tax=Desulfonema ishimotonii TaxID=45657 RepID=A0A401G4G6_9BACT|nr:AAA family ATPase [Desulfonema ishimotonii]GBC64138.1 ATPase [Desulfonema ishimotonii]
MLKKICIEGLFNKFNYEIELKNEGITILTGPNGYGKTTILKIIYAFAVKNLFFFFQLPFKKIVMIQENNEIELLKTESDTLKMKWGNKEPKIYRKSNITEMNKQLFSNLSYRQIDENLWHDRKTDSLYTTEELLNQLGENDPESQAKYYKKQMPDFGEVYLIKEQRLIRKNAISRRRKYPFYFEKEMKENFASTIEEYATDLFESLKDILANASKIGQELDSSFPRRLFDETESLSEEEFNKRYDVIKKKQRALSLYGLSATKEDSDTTFKEENATALLVYLNDTEKKLAVFDEILEKLQIFSNILNERQFVHKKFVISPDFGFRFTTEDGKELPLTELSSGEQQEVVLLYGLLFRAGPNTLVLIDEPEISLHVAWQKAFLNDLLKIVELRKVTVITATHSPQIIDIHWDLVIDLWDLTNGDEEVSE